MTCPNCGAEMEQRAFMNVCSFCGSISVTERTLPSLSKSTKDEKQFYEYIKKNLSIIQQSQFVDIKDLGETFECVSSKPFYPNDGHYTLDKSISFWWYTKISKQGIKISLLVNAPHSTAQNFICINVGRAVLTLKQTEEILGKKSFSLTFADFDFLCSETDFQIDTNMSFSTCLDYGEFATYTRRFYHIIIDKTKYRYSVNLKLLTD